VPSLPPHFLPRLDELVLLGNAVLADIKRPEVVNSAKQKTVIVGMGGMGKSVLAAAFARSTETRRAFKDGVAWISIGQNPDMLSNLRQLGLAFDDKMENYVDLKTARDKLPGVLADKVCLIVLDDIWNVDHAQPFINALGPRCRLLITTRDGGIVSSLEANEHRLGVLSDAAALRFLANWCSKEVDSLPPDAVSVAQECGNLPFALALCGAMARDGTSWPDMLDAWKGADLTFIEKKFPNYPYTNVLKLLKISADALENEYPEAVKYYQKLVVFHTYKKIPEAAIMTLWMHTDGLKERNARKLLTTLNSKALLTLEGETPQRFVTLHDLQHDYLRTIEGDRKKLHVELLEAYRQECKDGWSGGPNDGYFFENLGYHLVEAGRKDELRKLLLDFEWIKANLEATDANSLIRDYDFILDDKNLQLVQGAIRLSAHIISRDKFQLPSQLYGRLMGQEVPEIKGLMDQIRKLKTITWLRPLTPSLIPPGDNLISTLGGHTSWVNAVAVFQDGKCAISASWDKTIKVWDIETGQEIRTLMGHIGEVNALAVLPDRKRIISASSDNTIKVWDIETGQEIRTLMGHTGNVNALAVLPDGKRIISASYDKTIKFWNVETGMLIYSLPENTNQFSMVTATFDGRRLIFLSENKYLFCWDRIPGDHNDRLTGFLRLMSSVDFVKEIVIEKIDENKTIKVISENNIILLKLDGYKRRVNIEVDNFRTDELIAESENDDLKIYGNDTTLKIWDIENEKVIAGFSGDRAIYRWAVLPDGKTIIAGEISGKMHFLRLEGAD
jgi:WD40 repeat protein